MDRYMSDVEYEISDMAARIQQPFWQTTTLPAESAEKNRGAHVDCFGQNSKEVLSLVTSGVLNLSATVSQRNITTTHVI